MKKYILLLFWFSGFAQFNPVQWYLMGSKKTLKTNLVAHFKLNNNSDDEVFSNNGSDVGSISYVAGKFDEACRYASSSYNSIPHSANYNFSNAGQDTKYSINMWLSLDAINSTSFLLTKRSGGTTEFTTYCVVSGGDVAFTVLNNNSSSSGTISTTSNAFSFTAGVYYMVTFTYDGSESASGFKIYVNGSELVTTPATSGVYPGLQTTSGAMLIGNEIGDIANRYTRGNIDSVSLWKNRELNSDEVLELYNSGAGIDYPF